jgi:hypothetical protein
VPRELSRLKGQLAASHVADGFEPVRLDQFANELDPLDLIVRAYEHWERHRWPGSSGRLTFASAIFSAYLHRQLEHLSLRLWDAGDEQAEGRLRDVQRLVDRLNAPPAAHGFVRDARWLTQTAQSPLTLNVRPYFEVAGRIARAFPGAAGLEFHKSGAKLAGGHLRSQLRYRTWKSGKPVDDPELLGFMRYSNSMDCALLAGDLVPLLEAYREARASGDAPARLELADAILQGLSADPELYLTRLDLLAPSTVLEDLFVDESGDAGARYSALGSAHIATLARYRDLVADAAGPLREDAASFAPVDGRYSPYGAAYGFVADVLSNIAVDVLVGNSARGLSLEDMFRGDGDLDAARARAEGWRQLPRRPGELEHFDHSHEWAEIMFARLIAALEARARAGRALNASELPDARLQLVANGEATAPELCFTSDPRTAAAIGATPQPVRDMVADRLEGRFLASVESGGQWIGISKLLVTTCLAQGRSVVLPDMSPRMAAVLRLTCPDLVD